MIVTGVLANAPSNSHLQFDFISPMSSIASTNYDIKNSVWGSFNFYTYIQFNKNIDAADLPRLTTRIKEIYKTHSPDFKVDFHLQPLASIHLHSDMQIDLAGNGNIQYVNIFFYSCHLYINCSIH